MHLRTAATTALALCSLMGVAQADTTLSYTRGAETTACRADTQGRVVCVTSIDGVPTPQPGLPPVATWPSHPGLPMDRPMFPAVPTLPGQDDLLTPPLPFPRVGKGHAGDAPDVVAPPTIAPPMPDAYPDTPPDTQGMPGTPDMPDSGCALERAKALVGMAWDDSLLDGIAAPGAVRVLGPHDAATMDYSPTRLNILLDDARVVVDAHCG